MKKRIFSMLMALMLLFPTFAALIPLEVHADGYYCQWCDTYYPEDEDVAICFNCFVCESCADICDECCACYLCATELGFHCEECNESCVDEAYGDVPHCVMCMKCESCVELKQTSDGLMCEECIQENADNDGNTMCEHCGNNVIFNDEEGEDDDCAPCGVHCMTCYEEFYCPECDECTLCSDVELCEHCDICLECAVSEGYHCGYCDDGCYADVGQCPQGGDHCVNCCEDICEECGTCTWGAEIEYCDTCERCEDCWEHCEVCGDCMEEVGQCESGGTHCRECCASEDWICNQCERCTEALDLKICDYCGLCEECCAENSAFYGLDKCILNEEETDLSEVDLSKHDENHHILKYQSSSDECHDAWCIFPGCDYAVWDKLPHEYLWRTSEEPTVNKEGKKKGTCLYCGVQVEETIPKVEPPEYYFKEQPKDLEALANNKDIKFYIKIGEVGNDGPVNWGSMRISAIPILDDSPLPQTVKELYGNVYQDDVKEYHYWNYNMIYDAETGTFPCRLFGTSGNIWESFAVVKDKKYAGFQAQGKKLTWRLIVFDERGGKLTYSDPFTINWNAKHNKHTPEWVCAKLTKYIARYWSAFIDTTSPTAIYLNDNTYHYLECTTCGAMYGFPSNHHYECVGNVGNCVKAYRRYVCTDCGHVLDKQISGAEIGHTYSDKYYYDREYHWWHCQVKKCDYSEGKKEIWKTPHVWDKQTFRNCEKTITVARCKTCGYTYMERDSGTGHKYSNDGPLNGYYGDNVNHWKVCTECGKTQKGAHTYNDGHCTVCGANQPQMKIVGSFCQHGTLHIERSNDIGDKQKQRFDAGQYGVTWIDENTDTTLGIGKTYELTAADEGRSIRAEITFMNTEGWEWWEKDMNAYMQPLTISTKYTSVTGYEATCISEGVKAHQICKGCGKTFVDGQEVSDVTIPKIDHIYDNDCDAFCNFCGNEREIEHSWGKDYEFTEEGHTLKCTVCGAQSGLEPHQIEISEKVHGDCEHDGVSTYKCTVCAYSEDKQEVATGHSWIHADAVPALCTMTGFMEHYYCEYCYANATDAAGLNRIGPKKLETPLDPNNHIGGEKVGFNAVQHYTICQCGAHIEAADHTFDAQGKCTVCAYKKGSNVLVAIPGLTYHEGVPATADSEGIKPYYTDADGNIYLSPAGVKPVPEEKLATPKRTVRVKITFPFWIIPVIAGGVVLIAGAVVLIIVLSKRKRKKANNS